MSEYPSEPEEHTMEINPVDPAVLEEPRPRIGYLVTGLLCLGVVAVWALLVSGALTVTSLGWVFPTVLVAAGAVGLLASFARPARTPGGRR